MDDRGIHRNEDSKKNVPVERPRLPKHSDIDSLSKEPQNIGSNMRKEQCCRLWAPCVRTPPQKKSFSSKTVLVERTTLRFNENSQRKKQNTSEKTSVSAPNTTAPNTCQNVLGSLPYTKESALLREERHTRSTPLRRILPTSSPPPQLPPNPHSPSFPHLSLSLHTHLHPSTSCASRLQYLLLIQRRSILHQRTPSSTRSHTNVDCDFASVMSLSLVIKRLFG